MFIVASKNAYAASPAGAETKTGVLIWLFFGFVVIVLTFQAVPAIVMFFYMLKGKFLKTRSETIRPLRKDNK